MSSSSSNFESYLKVRLEDPELRAAYEDAAARRTLVQRLVELRRLFGFSQKQVATRMGVKQPTISGFEVDDSDPRLSTLQRYSRAIGACLSIDLHIRADGGAWKREGLPKAWRDSISTSTTMRDGFGKEEEVMCTVIPFRQRYIPSDREVACHR